MSESIDGRELFAMPDGVAYFNVASLAPQLRAVGEAARGALEATAEPWRIADSDWFDGTERLRSLFAEILGGDSEGVALVSATSYGLAAAARNTTAGPGDRILLTADDYPSTVYTWRAFADECGAEVITVDRLERQSWTEAVLGAIDERTRVVSVPNVRWTDGARLDLEAIGARTREVGATLALDLTQSLGAMPFDLSAVRPDFVVVSGYKWLMGPFGLAYLWVAPEHRLGKPIEHNWINRSNARDFASLTSYEDDFQPGARRFDVGQRTNFILTPMAIAALTQVLDWQPERLAATLQTKTDRIEAWAKEQGLGALGAGERGPHMLEVGLPPSVMEGLSERLAADQVFVGIRGASGIRVSPHLHIGDAEMESLFESLARAL